MNGFNIEQRKREAQQRIAAFTKALASARVSLDTAQEDLKDIEQEEVEVNAKAKREAKGESHLSEEVVLSLTPVERRLFKTILRYNVTIPNLIAKDGYGTAGDTGNLISKLSHQLDGQ